MTVLDAATYPQIPTNSTTYIDLAGIPLGLDRLTGEPADIYRNRLAAAAQLDRGAWYQGLLNEIGLQLGLLPSVALEISDSTGVFALTTTITGLQLINAVETLPVSFLSYDPDDFWSWRPISDIAADINSSDSFTANMPIDGLAYQIAQQTNLLYQVAEPVFGQTVKLAFPQVLQGTEVFSNVVPAYTFAPDGQTLHFAAPVPAGTAVSYSYRICPWGLVSSAVGIFSLLDPALPAAALTPAGNLTYQVREYLQELVARDRSYWAK